MAPARRSLVRPVWPLVACLLVAGAWPASEWWVGWGAVGTGRHRVVVEVGPGWLGLTAGANHGPGGPRTGRPPAVHVHRLTAADRAAMAFPQIYPAPGEVRFYTPMWMLTIAAGLFAAGVPLSRWRRRRRADRPGRCAACGYDLRATPDRCPECGAAAPPNAGRPSK